MDAMVGRRFSQHWYRIVVCRHAPRARVIFRETDKVGAFSGRALDRFHCIRDILLIARWTMCDRLDDRDAESHRFRSFGAYRCAYFGPDSSCAADRGQGAAPLPVQPRRRGDD
jgi:hypothetical protein